MDDIREYIENKRWRYKIVQSQNGPQFLIEKCPFCFDKNGTHFYISSITGQFYCHRCGQSGSLFTLKKHLGDLVEPISFDTLTPKEEIIIDDMEFENAQKAHLKLLQDKDVLLYLSSRCFSLEAVKHFKLGLSEEYNLKWLWFPYISSGKLKNIKKRTLPPAEKGFMRLIGGESSLYNEDILNTKLDYVTVCEGESDLVALWSKGFKNVVATSVGAQGIKNEWIEKLDKIPMILIAYDSDDRGQLGAQKLAARLGIEKCKQIKLPNGHKDINEYFQRGKRAIDFQQLIDNAETFDVEHVKSLAGFIQQSVHKIYAGEKENKLELPWKNVNKLLDGLAPGDLIVVAARPKVGKSSFSFNVLYHFAMMGIPVLLFSLEMAPWRILPRIVALHRRKDSRLCNDLNELLTAYKELKHVPFYLAYKYTKPNWDFVADTIRNCVRRYGIQFMVFDNLHFLCRSFTKQTEEVSVMSQNFKLLAEELAIPIMLIARPRKTSAKIISGEDLKDSADVEGDLDSLIILSRERKRSISGEDVEGAFEPKTLIDVPSSRYSSGGSTFLWAVDAEARFDEI